MLGGADTIITGDDDLLRLGEFRGIRIVRVADFLARFSGRSRWVTGFPELKRNLPYVAIGDAKSGPRRVGGLFVGLPERRPSVAASV